MKKWLTVMLATSVMQIAAAQSDIAKFFNQLQTFAADFSQTVKQEGQIVQQSKGKVWLKKPLQFRWNYKNPEAMQLISDGKKFYHYDIELAQATVKPIEEVTDTTLTTLLSDKKRLDELFTIQSFGAPAVKRQFPEQAAQWLDNADIFYRLTPKQKQSGDNQATAVILGLSASRELRVFYAKDAFGENTFIFQKVKQNTRLAAKQFRFNPPKGVDVLGQ